MPEKKAKKTSDKWRVHSINWPPELADRIAAEAEKAHRSFSGQVKFYIDLALVAEKKKEGKA